MNSKQISMVDELNSSKDHTVKVRILRVWKNYSWDNKQEIRSISMILMDQKGSKIECNVNKSYYTPYLKLFEEYVVVYIRNSTVGKHLGKIKYVDHEKQMYFKQDTTVTKCNDFDDPTYGFRFAKFQEILDNSHPCDSSMDVIGKVVDMEPLEKNKSFNKDTLQQNLYLEDLSGIRINVTLWGSYAQELVDYVANNQESKCLILIIQFAMRKTFNGATYVNNSMVGTKLFFNSDIEEVNTFKKELLSLDANHTSSSARTIGSLSTNYLRDEFMVKNKLYNISALHEIESGKSGIVFGTIKQLDGDTWYYIGCSNCRSKVPTESYNGSSSNNEVVCSKDKCRNLKVTAKPYFLVKVLVEGLIGSVILTLFDKEINSILNLSSIDLINKQEKIGKPTEFPAELYDLIEKKFAFKINVKTSPYGYRTRYYNISRFNDDLDIISELEDLELKITLSEQGINEDSLNIDISDITSTVPISSKDSTSFAGDNTPLSDTAIGI
ncbi:hypothetical protein LXL04_030169 [Taraxacum kok-saghyz]